MHVERSYSDAGLVVALKEPVEMNAAIRFIYREYYGMLENYVLNNNGSRDDAADVIQETIVAFIEIVEQGKFRGDSSIKSFLFAITRNLWLTELRKKGSADNRNKNFEKEKDILDEGAANHLIKREYFLMIQQLFEKLGDKCRQLLMMVYYENLSMTEIVDQMPGYQNEQVLRNKKYKCMKQLEQMMQDNETLRIQFKNALKNAG
jgi:RNA polymerase sigma factor (sigma-70 family)